MRSPVLCSQEGRSYWKIRQHYLLCCRRVPTAPLAPQPRLIPGQWIRRRLGQSPAGRQGRLAWQKVISSFSDFKRNFHFEQVAARGVAPPMPVRYGQLGRHRDGGATLAGTRLPPPVNVMVQPGLSPDHMEVPTSLAEPQLLHGSLLFDPLLLDPMLWGWCPPRIASTFSGDCHRSLDGRIEEGFREGLVGERVVPPLLRKVHEASSLHRGHEQFPIVLLLRRDV